MADFQVVAVARASAPRVRGELTRDEIDTLVLMGEYEAWIARPGNCVPLLVRLGEYVVEPYEPEPTYLVDGVSYLYPSSDTES